MSEGFPSVRKDDLRYYLDQDGVFTPQLRRHYEPLRTLPAERAVFLKCGSTVMRGDIALLRRGAVFAVMDLDGAFITWADDGTHWMVAMDDPVKNASGEWGVKSRKPTLQELQDA